MATDCSPSSTQIPPSQPQQNAANKAKLKDDEVLFKFVDRTKAGNRPKSIFERKMFVENDKVNIEKLFIEQASDILKIAMLTFDGKEVPFIYGVGGMIAGYSDNGKDNNINYNVPPEVLELLKVRALEYKSEMQDENAIPPGFELAIEDKYGNVRRLEKGDIRQLHGLGGMTLVIFLNDVHGYNGTTKEAEENQKAPEGSVNIRDVISNDILFNLIRRRLERFVNILNGHIG